MSREAKLEYGGLDLKIEFDYEPEEPQTRDYPGCPDSIEVTEVWAAIPEELFELLLGDLEEACWAAMKEEFDAQAEAKARNDMEAEDILEEIKLSRRGES